MKKRVRISVFSWISIFHSPLHYYYYYWLHWSQERSKKAVKMAAITFQIEKRPSANERTNKRTGLAAAANEANENRSDVARTHSTCSLLRALSLSLHAAGYSKSSLLRSLPVCCCAPVAVYSSLSRKLLTFYALNHPTRRWFKIPCLNHSNPIVRSAMLPLASCA